MFAHGAVIGVNAGMSYLTTQRLMWYEIKYTNNKTPERFT